MTVKLHLVMVVAAALAAGCAKTSPAPGGLGDSCIGNNDCASGFACEAGKCVLPANLGGCEPGRKRCNGADVEQCADSGLGWTLVTSCPTGCSAGSCRPQACSPGARRCEGDAAEQCTPAGDSWALVQVCPSHCDQSTGSCKAPVCTPFAVRCDPAGSNASQTCDSFGAAWVSTACASGTVCDGGRCQGAICAPGATRCGANGSAVETCNSLGDSWTATSSCSFGCGGGVGAATCSAAACQPGDTRCDLSALEQCKPDQTGFAFVTFCSSGCVPPGAAAAHCAPPVCAPGARSCQGDGITQQICSSDGSGWIVLQACPVACAGGECTTSGANCQPGDLRCNGPDAQLCTAAGNGLTQWTTQASCLAGCSSGACAPGGSCRSSGSGALVLHAAAAAAPLDGASSVLVYSDIIRAPDGSALPDGTVFTAQVTGPATIDSNPAGQAVRVQSIAGRIHFAVRSPAAGTPDFTATASATLLQSPTCAAQATIAFQAALAGPTVLIAEDFLSSKLRNVTQTTADWSTSRGALVADWPSAVGSGEDGPLCVFAGGATPDPVWGCAAWQQSPANLSSAFAASYAVLGLTSQGVTLDRPALALSGGDEVMLWDAQGSSAGFANAGSYEFLHVRAVDGSMVSFVEPVRGTYGAVADQNVSTQKVVLQRVAHFSKLVVLPGSTVTVDAWDGTRGGLLPIRVSGTAEVHGTLDVLGLGFRGGPSGTGGNSWGEDQTGASSLGVTSAGAGNGGGSAGHATAGSGAGAGQSYGLPLLGRIFLGAGGGGVNGGSGSSGGGAIYLSAGTLNLTTNNGAAPGLVRADGAGSGCTAAGFGAGGSLWLASPTLQLAASGSQVSAVSGLRSCGATTTGQGRIRFDSLTSTAAPCSRATGSCNLGLSGPLQGQSLDAFVAGSSLTIKQATLLFALGAPASASFFAAAANADLPSIDFGPIAAPTAQCTAPAGVVGTVCFNSSAVSPTQGPRFRWRAWEYPAPDAQIEQLVQGLQWSLRVQ